MTDFDTPSKRQDKTNAVKWSSKFLEERFGASDLLPFWVADMEFLAAPEIIQALVKRADLGLFGYEYESESLSSAIQQWYSKRYQWEIETGFIDFCSSVLNSIALAINAFTEVGDGIIIQTPVFFEFARSIRANNRQVVENQLKEENGQYYFDFEDLEAKAAQPNVRMLILSNPHNPVARVWSKDELRELGKICAKYDILLVADEMHGDLVMPGYEFVPFASLSEENAQISITCDSPAKTFNLAAVSGSFVIIPNEKLRQHFITFAKQLELTRVSAFAVTAMETAYREGEPWLRELIAYLSGNIDFVQNYLNQNLPQVQLTEHQATYLIWLDMRQLKLPGEQLTRFLVEKAKLALYPGHWFGDTASGYARMNLACPRKLLEQGLERLRVAL